jgi:hypothetical protein
MTGHPCAGRQPRWAGSGNQRHRPWAALLVVALAGTALVAACSSPPSPAVSPGLDRERVLEATWSSLEPNTSSGDRANWEVVEVRQVTGAEFVEQFVGEPAPGCWKGPTPVPNEVIHPTQTYWFVQYRPRPATPVPQERTISPTEPPAVPEPFMYQALFLVDAHTGRVVTRKLFCVIY